jgi:hypothetical protein
MLQGNATIDTNNITMYLDKAKQLSFAKILLFFYIIASNNLTYNLFSGQFQDFIKDNRYAQHIYGIITMYLVVNVIGGVTKLDKLLIYSISGYCLFLLTSKVNIQYTFVILLLILYGSLVDDQIQQKENDMKNDPVLSKKDTNKITIRHNMTNMIITITIICVSICGIYKYYNTKQLQYGGAGFDYDKFFLNGRN